MPDNSADLFICHASDDKSAIVRPLAETLIAFGADVWYDDFSLKLGDSLSRSLDRGLSQSNFGLVVLSPAFFEKDWTEYELRGLIAKEVGGENVILPLWHKVSREDVAAYSPPLADKVALNTAAESIEEIALSILEVARPDLFKRIHARRAYEEKLKHAKSGYVPMKRVKLGPIIHERLPASLMQRIRLIRAALLDVYPHSMEFWVDGFRGDAHPSEQVSHWERRAASFLEYCHQQDLNKQQRQPAFWAILHLTLGGPTELESIQEHLQELPDDALEVMFSIVKAKQPPFDWNEPFPSATVENVNEFRRRVHEDHVEEFDNEEWDSS